MVQYFNFVQILDTLRVPQGVRTCQNLSCYTSIWTKTTGSAIQYIVVVRDAT